MSGSLKRKLCYFVIRNGRWRWRNHYSLIYVPKQNMSVYSKTVHFATWFNKRLNSDE
uniref:Uncharacterized protein n=1 Tax=Anguilla anguilla TaxID=7936 RepID=A0A0E9P7V3_ANGAN